MNSSAGRPAIRREKWQTKARSTPQPSSSCSFSRRLVRRAGACSGVNSSRGCGSKVITVVGRPSSAPRAAQALEHGAMAQVQAIEIADGQHGGLNLSRCLGNPAKDQHCRLVSVRKKGRIISVDL